MNNNELNNNLESTMPEQMPTPTPLDVVAPVEVSGSSFVPTDIPAPIEAPGVQPVLPEKPKKSRKGLFVLFGLVLVIIVAVVIYFVVFVKDDKKETKDPTSQEETKKPEEETRPNWDPKTSIIKEADSDNKLVCTSETAPYSGMVNKITYTYLYKDDVVVQVIIEDEMLFSKDTMQYYDYYVGSGNEEVEYQKSEYDNITIEVRQKKSSVSLAYAYDYTADASNPKNMLQDSDLDITSMQLKMNKLNFKCE